MQFFLVLDREVLPEAAETYPQDLDDPLALGGRYLGFGGYLGLVELRYLVLDGHEGGHGDALADLGLAVVELHLCLLQLLVRDRQTLEHLPQQLQRTEESAVILERPDPSLRVDQIFLIVPSIESHQLT